MALPPFLFLHKLPGGSRALVLPVETGSGTFMSRPCFALWARRVGRAWGHGWCVGYADHAPLKPARVEGYVTPPLMPLDRPINRKGKLGAYTLKGRAHQRFLRWHSPPAFRGPFVGHAAIFPQKSIDHHKVQYPIREGGGVTHGPWPLGVCGGAMSPGADAKTARRGACPQGGGREKPAHRTAQLWS